MKSQAYWAAVKQHQLGDTDVDPDSQTLVVEHVVDLQEMEQNYYRFHQQGRKDGKERQKSREIKTVYGPACLFYPLEIIHEPQTQYYFFYYFMFDTNASLWLWASSSGRLVIWCGNTINTATVERASHWKEGSHTLHAVSHGCIE